MQPRRLPGTMEVRSDGHLYIGGCDAVELAHRFGTPLLVVDEGLIRDNARRFRSAFASSRYPAGVSIYYAAKAFLNSAMARLIDDEGLGLDVVSGGELYIALNAGFPPERILLNGNNKSEAEIRMALDAGVRRLVVDSIPELLLVSDIAAKLGRRARVLLRLTPGVEAHTHDYIRTGHSNSKFGIGIDGGQGLEATRLALSLKNIELLGFHCHIGSQIFALESYNLAARIMLDFLSETRSELGFVARELDLGGGLGIRYKDGDQPPTIEDYAATLIAATSDGCRERGLNLPHLLIEPGRSLVGEAGTTLYTVGTIKRAPGGRKYAAVDGGMTDNPRVALYQAEYTALVANRMLDAGDEICSIAGSCCESGDMLLWDAKLPELVPGDILAFLSTGAYTFSMSSNYNGRPRPAIVLVGDGRAELVTERETYADLIQHDVIPERLGGSRIKPVAKVI